MGKARVDLKKVLEFDKNNKASIKKLAKLDKQILNCSKEMKQLKVEED